ncbi:hypothetical protein PVV74_17410 [Roseovarius sp. SK2]|uniref:hypothetical protein n=1 Tax=Roseovarius TaxID=74030 RepID=UPI00237AFA9B|nr:hypothetical protein [Roseovarius sp. SK2]MDD9727241.1 hypothetical protein [Roseovarius sp. SK2]
MKIAERLHYDADTDTLTEIQTHDPNPVLDSVAQMKSNGLTGNSDKRHVGRVPFFLLEMWINEAGVRFDDQDAVADVLHKKLLSGEFNALRPWEGTY